MALIAILAADDFEDVELTTPRASLLEAGHAVDVIGAEAGDGIVGKQGTRISTDRAIAEADPAEYDALVLPGGYSPDHLRTDPAMVGFVAAMAAAGKPVAAICHAPWLLIEADLVADRTLTSWPSLRTDLANAGAEWVDEELVVDDNLITSRNPGDIPVFVEAILHSIGSPAR
ncbi:MAG: type 1 glutamine amidotransferase domain-containing protein [Acidimicrobiales bacterium]